jgi:sulfofructose kinase
MRSPDIVGLGLATLDVLIRLTDMPTWERAGSVREFGLDGGGPVATACAAAARLGARVGYVGTAGNDEAAALKLRSLRECGVDLSRLVVRPHPEDQVIVVYVNEETGERLFSGVHGFGRDPVRPEELDRDYLIAADCLHLDGTHYEAALRAARWMHEAGKQVCLDGHKTDGRPTSPHTVELVRHTDVLIAGSGFGRSLTGEDDPWRAGEAVLGLGPRLFVETDGENGCYTTTPGERFHTPAFPVAVVDTTGAGDVFHGAYLVGLLRGRDLKAVAQFASAVAALNCTRLGGRRGIPTFAEVQSFLAQHGAAIG